MTREQLVAEIKRLERELELARWHLDMMDKKANPPKVEPVGYKYRWER